MSETQTGVQLHLGSEAPPPTELCLNKPSADEVLLLWVTHSSSDGGLAGGFGSQCSVTVQEGEGGSKAARGHGETQTGPGAADGPAVTVIHISRQPIDKGWVSGKVIGHTGCIRAQRDGAEDP